MITLYRDISPNVANNTYFTFNNDSAYETALSGNICFNGDEKTYSYTDGVIRVFGAYNDIGAATYARIVASDGIPRYYHIDRVTFRSGFYYFAVSADLWATYMPKMSIRSIFVERCAKTCAVVPFGYSFENGQLNGFFNEKILKQPTVADPDGYKNSDLLLLFTVVIQNGRASIFSNGASTAYQTFAIELNDPDGAAVTRVSLIYGAKITGGAETPAGVVRAYIVPRNFFSAGMVRELPPDSGGVPYMEFMSGPNNIFRFSAKYQILNGFNITPLTELKNIFESDPFGLYFLTMSSGFMCKLPNVYNAKVDIQTVFSDNQLNFYLICDGTKTDFSTAFEFTIAANDANTTALQKIQSGLSLAGNIASGVFQIASGGAGIVSGGLSLAQTAANALGENKPRIVQGGGAGANFYTTDTYRKPFRVLHFSSVDYSNGLRAVAERGGILGGTVTPDASEKTPFKKIYNSNSLPTVHDSDIEIFGGVFLRGNPRVSGIPTDARQYVENAINNGIYFKWV